MMACKNEACVVCKQKHQLNDHGKRVSSFFKQMIGKSFSQILYFPPEFALSIRDLTNKKTYLEDSNTGQRWKVKLSEHDGSLAIQEGWSKFVSERGVTEDDLLVFHYVQGQHFTVQTFKSSGCEKEVKINSDAETGLVDINVQYDRSITEMVTRESGSDSGNVNKEASQCAEEERVIEKDVGEGPSRAISVQGSRKRAEFDEDETKEERVNKKKSGERPSREIIVKSSRKRAKFNEDETKEERVNRKKSGEDLSREIIVQGSRKRAEFNEDETKEERVNKKKSGECPSREIIGSRKRVRFDIDETKEERVKKKEFGEGPSREISGSRKRAKFDKDEAEEERVTKKDVGEGPSRAISVKGSGKQRKFNKEVIRSIDPDTPSLEIAAKHRCLVEVNGQDFLELPEFWMLGEIVIKLRGRDNKMWHVLYEGTFTVSRLTRGWKDFAAAYELNHGDDCVFILVDQQEAMFEAFKL